MKTKNTEELRLTKNDSEVCDCGRKLWMRWHREHKVIKWGVYCWKCKIQWIKEYK